MKTTNRLLISLITATGVIAGACSSEDKTNDAAKPIFQELQSYEIAAGETKQVSFEANMDWTLTSEKQWLKFVDQIGETQSLLGKPGSQNIQLKVSTGNLGFEGETALVTLTMGGQKSEIFKISRPGRQRTAKMYIKQGFGQDAPTIETPQIEIAYEGAACYVGFVANFDWRIISAPEWIMVNANRDIRELTGKANAENLDRTQMAILSVDPAAFYKDNLGEIVLGAQAEGVDFTQSFAITAAGIPADTIKWSLSAMIRSEGFIFSPSGKWMKNAGMGTNEEVDDPASCWVRTRDHKYTLDFVVWENGAPKSLATPWVDISDDRQGNLQILAKPNEGEPREAVLFVIPEGATVDYAEYFTPTGKILGGEFAIKISQKGVKQSGFFIRKFKSLSLFDELGGVEAASEENRELAEKIGIPADLVCQKSFTSQEWGYVNGIALNNQSIHLVPNDGTLLERFKNAKFYDQNGAELQMDATGWATISFKSTTDGMLACMIANRTDYASLADGEKLCIVFYDITDTIRHAIIFQKN